MGEIVNDQTLIERKTADRLVLKYIRMACVESLRGESDPSRLLKRFEKELNEIKLSDQDYNSYKNLVTQEVSLLIR